MNKDFPKCHIDLYCLYCNNSVGDNEFISFRSITCINCKVTYRVFDNNGEPYVSSWFTSTHVGVPNFDFELPKVVNGQNRYIPPKLYVYYDRHLLELNGDYLMDIIFLPLNKIIKTVERIKNLI